MTDLVFYTNPMSRGRIVRWMLEEIGRPYHTEIIGHGPPMKSATYLAINPMGKVPAIRHGDHIITEAAAICAYLAETFPETGLGPTDDERADYYRWLFFAAGPLEHAITNHSLGFEPREDKRRMVGYGSYNDTLNTLEMAVSKNPYIAGQRFTAADVYMGSQVGWGLQFGTLESRPAFVKYWDHLKNRDALKHANAIDEAAMADLKQENG